MKNDMHHSISFVYHLISYHPIGINKTPFCITYLFSFNKAMWIVVCKSSVGLVLSILRFLNRQHDHKYQLLKTDGPLIIKPSIKKRSQKRLLEINFSLPEVYYINTNV